MTLVLKRAEIWTELACNSGVPKAVLPLETCVQTEHAEGVVVVPRLQCAVPSSWSQRAEVVNGRVIRLLWTDDTFEEFRILTQSDVDQGDGLLQIEAAGPILDLASRNTLVSLTTTGVTTFDFTRYATLPSTILNTDCCGAGPSYFTAPVGVVTPTALIDVTMNGDTALSGAIKVATEANRVTNVTYWLVAQRNGTSGYYLTLQIPAGGAGTPHLAVGKNILTLRRRQDSQNQTTRAFVRASNGAHCGNNWWTVSAKVLNTSVDLVDILGGPGPVRETDQFDNLYLESDDGTLQQITGSSDVSGFGTTGRFLIGATANFDVGKRCRIVADNTPNDIQYVDAVLNKAAYGVKVGVLQYQGQDTYNAILNPDIRSAVSGTSAASWTITGGGVWALDTSIGNYRTGGQSVKWTSGTVLFAQQITYQVPASGNWYANYAITFKVDANGTAGTGQMGAFYDGSLLTNALGGVINLNDYDDGQWHTVYQSWKPSSGSHTFQVSCSMARSLWFDSGMIYFTKEQAEERPFARGSNGAEMIALANAHLLTNGAPLVSYDVDLVDLYRVDPVTWSGDRFGLGTTAKVVDANLGLPGDGSVNNNLRIVEIVTDHLVPAKTRVVLSNRREQLPSLLAA